EGAAVAIADLDESRGAAEVDAIRGAGGQALFVRADVGDLADIDRMLAAAIAEFDRLDILVNNAAVTRRIGVLDITPDDWDWIQNVNSRGLFFCLQGAARHMKASGGGRIINISSIAGKGVRGASNASYAASKAAAIAIARIAANELGPHNITVNSICPGPTRSDMLSAQQAGDPQTMSRLTALSALGRLNEPEDIGQAVVFLASEMGRNITGQSLNVDGGIVWD
ncbi:MAG TPA: SDR family oxidoreductase, partial [Ramlibacter sp.]|nr:SDR family oxidoreductase [Ramlibacter sp.]